MNRRQTIIWGDEVNALRLGIFLDKSEYKLKEPIVLEIWITNVSAVEVKIIETYILREHNIKVFSTANQPIPMTEQGQKALEASESDEIYRRISVTLKPGEIYKVKPSVYLDEWFKLDQAGVYTVKIQRKDWQNHQESTISSSAQFSLRH